MSNSKFQLVKIKNTPVSDEELINDLKRVSEVVGTEKITQKLYAEHGQFDVTTVTRRFGTWNKALVVVGLSITNRKDIQDEKLYENILLLWQHFGRQPRRAELAFPPSTISQSAYNRRFGGWVNALESFVQYANAGDVAATPGNSVDPQNLRRNGRDPSLRLRFKVMLRDNFTCKQCGASPAKQLGVELHVDHVIAWSKGGETTFDNLQTLCLPCNLGKSNL
ncbi:MAG: hypothetical protein RL020_1521 [Pseudomonadota bacterium]|jgi:HNH endonuclease/Homing endonuclease associated repeat